MYTQKKCKGQQILWKKPWNLFELINFCAAQIFIPVISQIGPNVGGALFSPNLLRFDPDQVKKSARFFVRILTGCIKMKGFVIIL